MCANAARLAQSKGLHRQPAKSWALPENEVLHRNWLFWAIYCVEKYIAYRSGRPSAIDDNDISCEIPSKIAPGSTIGLEYFVNIIKHAQIASEISTRLASCKAFRQTPEVLAQTASELSLRLRTWKTSLPAYLQPGASFKSLERPHGIRNGHIIYLHYAYYGSLMAIHTIFTYPWISAALGIEQSLEFQSQIFVSTNAVAEAARSILMTTRDLEIDAGLPQVLAFYYPIIGLINLFIYILKFPNIPSAPSDVALMDVGTGHFGTLEFITKDLSFHFAREVAAIASATVSKAKGIDTRVNTLPPTPMERSRLTPSMELGHVNDVRLRSHSITSGWQANTQRVMSSRAIKHFAMSIVPLITSPLLSEPQTSRAANLSCCEARSVRGQRL